MLLRTPIVMLTILLRFRNIWPNISVLKCVHYGKKARLLPKMTVISFKACKAVMSQRTMILVPIWGLVRYVLGPIAFSKI